MKAFRFTLQAVLTLREREEQQALEHYARTVEAWERARQALTQTEGRLDAVCREWAQAMQQGCPAGKLAHLRAYSQGLETEKREREKTLEAARQQAARAWQQFLEARHARQVLERFRQWQQRDYLRRARRREQRVLDDLAALRRMALPGETRWPSGFWN